MRENFLKLTNTVYKILEFFPESDPIKNRAKDRALSILEKPTPEDIDALLGYLWIAKNQGWLSSVNYLIVANEYEKIRTQMASLPVLRNTEANKGLVSNSFNKRQTKILEFLDNNEKAQVMDLQKMLPSVTKRTIRRDLDELLKSGRVARFGEFNQIFYRIADMT